MCVWFFVRVLQVQSLHINPLEQSCRDAEAVQNVYIFLLALTLQSCSSLSWVCSFPGHGTPLEPVKSSSSCLPFMLFHSFSLTAYIYAMKDVFSRTRSWFLIPQTGELARHTAAFLQKWKMGGVDGYLSHLNIKQDVAGPYNLDTEAIFCEQRQPEKRKWLLKGLCIWSKLQ